MKVMLQKLFAERFSLASHKDGKELSAYAITVVKSGVKIKKEENATIPVPGSGGQPQNGFNARNATLGEFANVMQAQFMDLPVIDQTGLGDTRYTFIVKFTPDPGSGPSAALLLRLRRNQLRPIPKRHPTCSARWSNNWDCACKKRRRVEVMVIDKIEKPSSN